MTALKIAATGNVMDSAIYSGRYLESFLKEELDMPFAICDDVPFKEELEKAKRIMIIGDNAGETVFDKDHWPSGTCPLIIRSYMPSGMKPS